MTDEMNTDCIQIKLALTSYGRPDLVDKMDDIVSEIKAIDGYKEWKHPYVVELEEAEDKNKFLKDTLESIVLAVKKCKDINQVNKIINFYETKSTYLIK